MQWHKDYNRLSWAIDMAVDRRLVVICGMVLLFGSPRRLLANAVDPAHADAVRVEIFENLSPDDPFDLTEPEPTTTYTEPAFGFVRIPTKYSINALPMDRSTPFVLRATFERHLTAGHYQFRLRSKGAARFTVNGETLLRTQPQTPNKDGNDPVPPPAVRDDSPLRPAAYPHQDAVQSIDLAAGTHRFVLVAVIGGKGLVPDPGELSVSIGRPETVGRLLGDDDAPELTDAGWEAYAARAAARHHVADRHRRRSLSAPVVATWNERHRQVRDWVARQPAPKAPSISPDTPVNNDLDRFVGARLEAAAERPTPLTDDLAFLRRVTLDVVGLIPTPADIETFLAEPSTTRRQRVVDRLLDDPGWADGWVSYWQDVLAENPGILKPDLNNTGPFRWWLHQSFADGMPFDRLVTELIEMEGSAIQGAPAGFGQAKLNDAPAAAKADILSQAFLGRKLSCARCHDAPFHPFEQKHLFGIAAMLEGKAIELPETSTVPVIEGTRPPLVNVTLRPGDVIEPAWPFADLIAEDGVASPPAHGTVASRHQLASLLVSPKNERFAQVVVNRIWKRYMGLGLVEPADDWSDREPTDPALLRYLAREFLLSGYDVKHVARLILTSHAYQREPVALPATSSAREQFRFAGPTRRRMSAEQVVDALFGCVGKHMACEELNLNPAGDRPYHQFLNLGAPTRAWHFTALSNERDRPALALPVAQSIVDVLTAFGWRQSRQNPVTTRDDAPSGLQTLILANGTMSTRLVSLSDDNRFTKLCLQDLTLPTLVREVFLRVLTRSPTEDESRWFEDHLREHFSQRIVDNPTTPTRIPRRTDRRVSWSNHLSAEATVIRMEEERRLRRGDPPTHRLTPAFREAFEDVLWALINSPEFVMIP